MGTNARAAGSNRSMRNPPWLLFGGTQLRLTVVPAWDTVEVEVTGTVAVEPVREVWVAPSVTTSAGLRVALSVVLRGAAVPTVKLWLSGANKMLPAESRPLKFAVKV